jgi:hypothetical protein
MQVIAGLRELASLREAPAIDATPVKPDVIGFGEPDER